MEDAVRAARRTGGREILLLLASATACLVVLEASLRVASYMRHRATFEEVISNAPKPGPHQPATLGHLLRPSRNPRIIYELRPNLRVKATFGRKPVRVETNSQGFRDDEYPTAKPPGAYRIVGIGDSLMFGWGLGQGKDYLSILERRLQRLHPERRWEVINTAVPGYNTAMELETLKTRGLAYQPDLVIVGFCGNDFDLPNFIWADEPAYTSFGTSFLVDFVKGRLAAGATGQSRNAALQIAPGTKRAFEGDPERVPPRYRDMVGWESFARSLREMRALGIEHRFRVALLVFLPRGWPRVFDYARDLGLGVIDVRAAQEAYMQANGIRRYEASRIMTISDTDPHPTQISHRLAAGEALDWLASQGIFETPGRAAEGRRWVKAKPARSSYSPDRED